MSKSISILDKDYLQQLAAQFKSDIFRVPQGHQKLILDKVKGDVNKALFYVRQVLENGWSRAMLLNFITTSEYDLEKFYPEKVEGTIPTVAEIEAKLSN